MVKKPSYEELEQRVKELEAAVSSPANKDFERLFPDEGLTGWKYLFQTP